MGLHQRVHQLVERLLELPHSEGSWQGRIFAQLHGDLSVGNILWDGEAVWLLDWEYARQGDPAEEMAYLLTEQELPRKRWNRLRDAYIAAGGLPGVWERLPAYLPLVTLDSALWWADYLRARDVEPAMHPEFLSRVEKTERLLDG
jgi:thiamine kinase-like enzyme